MNASERPGEDNPRPTKRQKIENDSDNLPAQECPLPPPLTLSSLLLALPALLLHPPTHPNHLLSLTLSYHAFRKCTMIANLYKVLECRALTGLAELGLQLGPVSSPILNEIQRALAQSSLIAQKLPTLRLYRYHLAQLSCRLSLASGNPKLAQNTLKRLLSSFSSSELPHVVYSAHLALIGSIRSQAAEGASYHMRCLGAIHDLQELAITQNHRSIVQLASVLRLHTLMHAGLWNDVGESLDAAETLLQLTDTLETYANEKQNKHVDMQRLSNMTSLSKSLFEYALAIHALILGVVFHTHTGDATLSAARLKHLHELLDVQLPKFPKTGIFEIQFSNAPLLYYRLTHPRILYTLGFLVSSLAKRDLVGRQPKKKVFASEGLNAVDKELRKELHFPVWAPFSDVQEVDHGFRTMRADLMCELIAASIMRSEFEDAEKALDEFISYVRTHELLTSYVSRITLFEAQLAHASNKPTRALQCYQVAAWLSRRQDHRKRSTSNKITADSADGEENLWINTTARAGELWLRIGLLRRDCAKAEVERVREMEELRCMGDVIIKDCRSLGGTLETIAEVLESCLTKELVKAKSHLRRALNLSTSSQDNHLRALVLALVASHYIHTSHQHAEKMLETADSLAAGHGAQTNISRMVARNTSIAIGGNNVCGLT